MALLSAGGEQDNSFHGHLELSEAPMMQRVLQRFMLSRYHAKAFPLMIFFFSPFRQICVSHC